MAFKSIWSGVSLMAVNFRDLPANSDALESLDYRPFSLHVVGIDTDSGQSRQIPCTAERDQQWRDAMRRIAEVGPIYFGIDAYLLMFLQKACWSEAVIAPLRATYERYKGKEGVYQVSLPFDDSMIAGVFPWPAEEVCESAPPITPITDRICRNVARYYLMLNKRPVRDWNGMLRCFPYKVANTISYRAYAPYHNIPRDQRFLIAPEAPNQRVLQFDWTAAEWSLILQHCGYALPEGDPYGAFTANGIERDTAKVVVLAHIYGAAYDTLVADRDPKQVDGVISQIRRDYPEVLSWREVIRDTTVVDFHGFQITLGDEPHKRANRWAQTALQFCKWELISRLVDVGAHAIAAGDLHDQLIFHFDPATQTDLVKASIVEINKPCFHRYDLRPKFKAGEHWQ